MLARLTAGSAVFFAIMLAGAVTADRATLVRHEVASAWGDIPMRCDVTGIDEDERAFEVFRCRAVGGGALPPGTYRTPDAQWISDITRRDALANTIVITRAGDLTGWALY